MFVAAWHRRPSLLASALFIAGASDAITDVGQNAHASAPAAELRTFDHQLAACGVVGRRGTRRRDGCGRDRVAHPAHNALGGVCGAVQRGRARRVSVSAARPGPGRPPVGRADNVGRPGFGVYATLVALVFIAIAGAVVEDAASSWATVYLRDSLGAPGAIAVSGYIAMVGFQFVGRIIGDRLVDRFGERTVARAGGLITAAGMGAALAFPSVPGTIAGFAAAGFGVATVVPAAMHAADQLPGLRAGTGLTVVTWLMRVGFVSSPPVVGLIADATSLRVGLWSCRSQAWP